MIKKPMTTKELFETICKKLKEKNLLPDILDYSLGKESGRLIDTNCFSLKSNLDFGESEGIYLDLYLDFYDDVEARAVEFGTFKTLENSDEAMHTMANLLADFLLELNKYMHENSVNFEWFQGTLIKKVDEDGKQVGIGRYAYSEKETSEVINTFFKEHDRIIVYDLGKREETLYTKSQIK